MPLSPQPVEIQQQIRRTFHASDMAPKLVIRVSLGAVLLALLLFVMLALSGCGLFMGPCADKNKNRDIFWGNCYCSGANCGEGFKAEGDSCTCVPMEVTRPAQPSIKDEPYKRNVNILTTMEFVNNGCSFAQNQYVENKNGFPVLVTFSPDPATLAVPGNSSDRDVWIGVTHLPPRCDRIQRQITSISKQ